MTKAILKKSGLGDFIAGLAQAQKVVAPVAKGGDRYVFAEISSAQQIALNYIPTILPPKKYFMPQRETLINYDLTTGQKPAAVVESETMVIFGVHTCDLAGIQCLDMVFSEEPEDLNYLARKKRLAIIGLACNNYCDEYASCKLADNHTPNGGYDLFLTELVDSYFVHINTELGDKLVKQTPVFSEVQQAHLKELEKILEQKNRLFQNEVRTELEKLPKIFAKSWQSPVWQELGRRCLACGNCTNVCPTCYCFDVIDEPDLDLKRGRRYRQWDSCQHETFAQVAGGENFRKERAARQRHRYYRKFKYPLKKFSRLFCTGCGRCSRACMAKINLKETLSQLIKEQAG